MEPMLTWSLSIDDDWRRARIIFQICRWNVSEPQDFWPCQDMLYLFMHYSAVGQIVPQIIFGCMTSMVFPILYIRFDIDFYTKKI